jgi:integrase
MREWKASLNTSDINTARHRCRKCSSLFEQLIPKIISMPDLTPAAVRELVRGYYRNCLTMAEEQAFLIPMDGMIDVAAEIAGYENDHASLQKKIGRRAYSLFVISEAESLMAGAGFAVPPRASEAFDAVCNGILRASAEQRRVLAALLRGDMGKVGVEDPLFSSLVPDGTLPSLPGEIVTPAMTLGVVIGLYVAIKVKLKHWVGKTEGENKRVLSMFSGLVGENHLIGSLADSDVRQFRDAVMYLPPNFSKLKEFAGMSVAEVVAICEVSGSHDSLAPKTARKYIENLHSFLNWCVRESYIAKHPGAQITINAKVKEKEARHPFSRAQLEKFFASPLYNGQKSASRRSTPGPVQMKDDKFWLPLVGLFSGMRLGEIVQLLVTDIKTDDGVPYFDIAQGANEDKQLKSDAATRRVPIHPILIQLGFMDYVDRGRKNSASGRIFYDVPKGPDGYFSHHPSKWFGRYFIAIGVKTAKTTFHSFRHNFKDALVAANVDITKRKALMGHSDDDTHANYGSDFPIRQLHEALVSVAYSFDLSNILPT